MNDLPFFCIDTLQVVLWFYAIRLNLLLEDRIHQLASNIMCEAVLALKLSDNQVEKNF